MTYSFYYRTHPRTSIAKVGTVINDDGDIAAARQDASAAIKDNYPNGVLLWIVALDNPEACRFPVKNQVGELVAASTMVASMIA